MTIKNKLTEEMKATRGGSHGKITSLENGFKLKSDLGFYILILEKASVTGRVIAAQDTAAVLVSVILHQEDTASDYPFVLLQESVPMLRFIEANAIDLATYDVYWSCGQEAEPFYVVAED